MSIEILDGSTILSFISDHEAFGNFVRSRFTELDTDKDGFLSFPEMLRELKSLRVLDLTDNVGPGNIPDAAVDAKLYRELFTLFDRDSDGKVSAEEYFTETKEMMIAIASGLGSMPIQMVLDEDSLFKKAVEREASLA